MNLKFGYYYENEKDCTFIKMPKFLFTDIFSGLRFESKSVYSLLLDRMSLSYLNGKFDSSGRLYIVYTIKELCVVTGYSDRKVRNILKELSDFKLIEKVKQGYGIADRIYVKKVLNANDLSSTQEVYTYNEPEVAEDEQQDTYTLVTDTVEPISRSEQETDDTTQIKEKIAVSDTDDTAKQDFTKDVINIISTVCTKSNSKVIVGKSLRSVESVRNRLLQVDNAHVDYVYECFKNIKPNSIRRIDSYILTSLYNSFDTMNIYNLNKSAKYNNHRNKKKIQNKKAVKKPSFEISSPASYDLEKFENSSIFD